jgi:hypothetical protein
METPRRHSDTLWKNACKLFGIQVLHLDKQNTFVYLGDMLSVSVRYANTLIKAYACKALGFLACIRNRRVSQSIKAYCIVQYCTFTLKLEGSGVSKMCLSNPPKTHILCYFSHIILYHSS